MAEQVHYPPKAVESGQSNRKVRRQGSRRDSEHSATSAASHSSQRSGDSKDSSKTTRKSRSSAKEAAAAEAEAEANPPMKKYGKVPFRAVLKRGAISDEAGKCVYIYMYMYTVCERAPL
jgi:hypothetical protein